MKEFQALIEVVDTLLGENGCPWDREQTLETMRSSVLEEVGELIDAINLKDGQGIEEELGDVLFNAVFLCRMAEKQGYTDLGKALNHIRDKLVRRHPHVFGDSVVENSAEVIQQWGEIKKTEKREEENSRSLPTLKRAEAYIQRAKKAMSFDVIEEACAATEGAEDEIGEALYQVVVLASLASIDPDQALRKVVGKREGKFSRK